MSKRTCNGLPRGDDDVCTPILLDFDVQIQKHDEKFRYKNSFDITVPSSLAIFIRLLSLLFTKSASFVRRMIFLPICEN
jgi:hypothetical protein